MELIDIGSLQLKNWDSHADMRTRTPLALNVDQAITAGLIHDLKGRGMLERLRSSGRPTSGASLRIRCTPKKTTDITPRPIAPGWHLHDFQTTILNQMGLDHTNLTCQHDGRDFPLTDVEGHVIREVLV